MRGEERGSRGEGKEGRDGRRKRSYGSEGREGRRNRKEGDRKSRPTVISKSRRLCLQTKYPNPSM